MRLARSRAEFRRGFTLIELMVVCVLVGVLTAIIIPEMTGTYEDSLLRSTGRELVNAFSLAYSQAVGHNRIQRVRLDSTSGKYFVETRVVKEAQQDWQPMDGTGGEGKLDSRISVQIERLAADETSSTRGGLLNSSEAGSSGEPVPAEALEFYPDGTADAGKVILRDRAGFGLELRVNPITARVRIAALERQ